MKAKTETKPKLIVRQAQLSDVERIIDMSRRAYPGMEPYSPDMLRSQMTHYPEGQFTAEYDGKIVGYCAGFRIDGEIALQAHTWNAITSRGYFSRHDPEGDFLYGADVSVDPAYQNLKIGQRFYNERRKLCRHYRLKGIVFGGRMPGLAKRLKKFGSPEKYIDAVRENKIRDKVIGFQMRNGFECIGILKNYLPYDQESLGFAAHMVWRNPWLLDVTEGKKLPAGRMPATVRLTTVQYKQRRITSFEEFGRHVEFFVKTVAGYSADFVLFPEMLSFQLLSMEEEPLPPLEAIERLAGYSDDYKALMTGLAIRYNVNIIAGTHPVRDENGELYNVSFICLRDGSIHLQPKIHPTPTEKNRWNIKGGSTLRPVMTDCGPVGVLICYDVEFPELARHLADQGAKIIFVPFCTDERQGYNRVRYCAQARAIENQCYMVMSGSVGNLPGVENMDIQYARSCILTPCDFPFARDGIAADTTPNVETVAFADLRIENLLAARNSGTVQNLKDRRYDLYTIEWHGV